MTLRSASITAVNFVALLMMSVGSAEAQTLREATVAPVAARKPADDASLRLRLRAHIVSAPADFGGLVSVTPDANNRLLRVVLDSENFYRSSDIQLEGDRSPQSHFLAWRSLPAGTYRIVVTVFDARGPRTQLSQEFLVIGDVP